MRPLNSPKFTSAGPELLFNSQPLFLWGGRFVANHHVDDIYHHKYEKEYEETVQANKRKGYTPSSGDSIERSHMGDHLNSLYLRRYSFQDFMNLVSNAHVQVPGWRDDGADWAIKKLRLLDSQPHRKRHYGQAGAEKIKRLTGEFLWTGSRRS